MIITYDEPKRLANWDKHGLDFCDLNEGFFSQALSFAAKHNRFMAVGRLQSKLVVALIYKPLGSEALSIISMRHANQHERKILDEY